MAADRQTAIGAFAFGGLALALGAIILFGNFRLFRPTTRAAIVFEDSISGLSVGSPVTFRGVRVGAVQNIALQFDPKTHTAYIPVTVQLEPDRVRIAGPPNAPRQEPDLSAMVTHGLRAEVNIQSFVTGQSEIDLDFDPSSPAELHPNVTALPEIPTRLSTLQRVKEQLSKVPVTELIANANAALDSLQHLSARLDSDLPPLINSLKTLSDKSSDTLDVAAKAITDVQGRLNETMAGVAKLTATSDQQISQRGADLHELLTSTNETVQQARETLNGLRSLTSTRGTARVNLESTLRDLAASAASLRGFANDIEHNPQVLLTGRRP